MSVLDPKSGFDDTDLREIMFNDFGRGLEIITAKVQKQVDRLYSGGIFTDTQRAMTEVAHDAFFEFGVHWNLEYRIYCTPIVQPDNIRPVYIIEIHFKKPYSMNIQTITINVNP